MNSIKNNISSRYINGWTIYKGILDLNTDPALFHNWSFFTEEDSLRQAIQNKSCLFKPKIAQKVVDDKLELYYFLISIGESPVPSYSIDTCIEYPIYLKAKHSWMNGKKLPRGWICEDSKFLQEKIQNINENEDLDISYFFFQKRIDHLPIYNISVSGYYDYSNLERNCSIVTRKIMKPSLNSAGTIIETIQDPRNLVERSYQILSHLKYDGPFELEYLFDKTSNLYYVLELNPRFWMQHSIFLDFFDNAILKRYLNLESLEDYNQGTYSFRHIIWIDTIGIFASLLKGDIRPLRECVKATLTNIKVSLAPDLVTAIIYTFKKIFNAFLFASLNLDLF